MQRVQYVPTVNGVPIFKSEASPEKPKDEKPEVPKKKYPSLMNKSELVEAGKLYGLEFDIAMKKKFMVDKIRKAKKHGNRTGANRGIIS